MKSQERDLVIAYQGRVFFIPEDEVDILDYSIQKLDQLAEGLPEPFLMNFWWFGSARRINEEEQRRIIKIIEDGWMELFGF